MSQSESVVARQVTGLVAPPGGDRRRYGDGAGARDGALMPSGGGADAADAAVYFLSRNACTLPKIWSTVPCASI